MTSNTIRCPECSSAIYKSSENSQKIEGHRYFFCRDCHTVIWHTSKEEATACIVTEFMADNLSSTKDVEDKIQSCGLDSPTVWEAIGLTGIINTVEADLTVFEEYATASHQMLHAMRAGQESVRKSLYGLVGEHLPQAKPKGETDDTD